MTDLEAIENARNAWLAGHRIALWAFYSVAEQHGFQLANPDPLTSEPTVEDLRATYTEFLVHARLVEPSLKLPQPIEQEPPWRFGGFAEWGPAYFRGPGSRNILVPLTQDQVAAYGREDFERHLSEMEKHKDCWLARFLEAMRALGPDLIEEALTGQSLEFYRVFKTKRHWVSFKTLRDIRQLWNTDDPKDATIKRALERFESSLTEIEAPLDLEIEAANRRARLTTFH